MDHKRVGSKSKSHISRLLSDVLNEVFFHLADPDALESTDSEVEVQVTEVAEVCKSWRAVALNCPTLWSVVKLPTRRNLPLQLDRSKSAPLTVDIELTESYQDEEDEDEEDKFDDFERAVSLLFEQSDRFRTFRLSNSAETPELTRELELLQDLFADAPLGQLHTIDIQGDTFHVDDEPNYLFQNKAMPSLRNVTFHLANIPWKSPIFKGLTSLSLIQENTHTFRKEHRQDDYDDMIAERTESDYAVTLQDVLNILRQCPLLVTLELNIHVREVAKDSADRKADPVNLPCLTGLVLELDPDSYSSLKQHLVYPPTIEEDISFRE